MNILIDIIHTADVNFYKQAVQELSKKHKIIFTILKRGRLPQIMKKEYPDHEQIVFGKHYSSFIGKLFTITLRQLCFFRIYATRKIDVVSSFGFYPGFLTPLFGIRAINFHDDKEYCFNFKLTRAFASRFVSLCPTKETKKTRVVNSYKELSYLFIKTDDSILKTLGVQKEKYVYVREVASTSLNYKGESHFSYQKTFDHLKKRGFTILFDGEAESNPYTNVKQIKPTFSTEQMMSINKHAALIITSGDTILREGALMGVPTIYTSSRDMAINRPLHEAGLFEIALDDKTLLTITKKILKEKRNLQKKAKKIVSASQNMTAIIVEELTK